MSDRPLFDPEGKAGSARKPPLGSTKRAGPSRSGKRTGSGRSSRGKRGGDGSSGSRSKGREGQLKPAEAAPSSPQNKDEVANRKVSDYLNLPTTSWAVEGNFRSRPDPSVLKVMPHLYYSAALLGLLPWSGIKGMTQKATMIVFVVVQFFPLSLRAVLLWGGADVNPITSYVVIDHLTTFLMIVVLYRKMPRVVEALAEAYRVTRYREEAVRYASWIFYLWLVPLLTLYCIAPSMLYALSTVSHNRYEVLLIASHILIGPQWAMLMSLLPSYLMVIVNSHLTDLRRIRNAVSNTSNFTSKPEELEQGKWLQPMVGLLRQYRVVNSQIRFSAERCASVILFMFLLTVERVVSISVRSATGSAGSLIIDSNLLHTARAITFTVTTLVILFTMARLTDNADFITSRLQGTLVSSVLRAYRWKSSTDHNEEWDMKLTLILKLFEGHQRRGGFLLLSYRVGYSIFAALLLFSITLVSFVSSFVLSD